MARTTPTEESLGLAPTEEELATSVSPPDDDIPLGDDEPEPVAPLKETKPVDKPAEALKELEKPAEEPKTVDLRALQEARAEAREARQTAAILERRMNEILAGQNAPKPAEPPPVPTWDQDPLAAGKWTQDQLLAMQRQEQERQQQFQRQSEEHRAMSQVLEQVNTAFEQAKTADPTITEAHKALRQSIAGEMQAMGYSQREIAAHIAQTENWHAVRIAQSGANVGEYIKGLAKARGWNAAPAPAPARTDLAAVAAAQQRHQSLSDAPGGETVAPLDAKALAKMSDKEFKVWMSKKGNEAKFDEIMGA